MFTYKILNTDQIVTHVNAVIEDGVELSPAVDYTTLKLLVEYTFNDDIVKNIELSIFNPKNQDYIDKSIHNRGVTEENKLT